MSGLAVFWQMPMRAVQSVALGWEPSSNTNVVGYNIYYGTNSHDYPNKISVGNVTNATIPELAEGETYYFAATTSAGSGEESEFSNEASYAVPKIINRYPPTLNSLGNVTLKENAAAKTVVLSGITSGAKNEIQTLLVTASSSNPSLIPDPSVNYTSPNKTGTLTFKPNSYASGRAVITVIVNDGGITNNIFKRNFTVTVTAVNQLPTLDTVSNFSIDESAASQTVALTGISSGAPNENQILKITAVSSRTALIKNPVVTYASPNATGTLTFQPVAKTFGTAIITVTVNDGGKSPNSIKKAFFVTVNAVNQPPTLNDISDISLKENSAAKTISLSGITSGAANEKQKLTVTAVSSNPLLISDPVVKYTSPKTTGTLSFKPVTNGVGTAMITVTASDSGTSNNIVTKTFTITINGTNATPSVVETPLVKLAPTTVLPASPAVISTDILATTNSAPTIAKTAVAADTYSVIMTNNITGSSTSPANNLTVDPSPAATLSDAIYENGQYACYVSGLADTKYVVQASTNLVDWVSVETNTAPFTFVDPNAGQFNQRFYRAVSQSSPP